MPFHSSSKCFAVLLLLVQLASGGEDLVAAKSAHKAAFGNVLNEMLLDAKARLNPVRASQKNYKDVPERKLTKRVTVAKAPPKSILKKTHFAPPPVVSKPKVTYMPLRRRPTVVASVKKTFTKIVLPNSRQLTFKGLVWPLGHYSIYVLPGNDEFQMGPNEEVESSHSPVGTETRQDGQFEAQFEIGHRTKPWDTVHLHIFGDGDLHVPNLVVDGMDWGKKYAFDLKRQEIVPFKYLSTIKHQLEAKDRADEQAEADPDERTLMGIVWPIRDYTLFVSPQDFDLDDEGNAAKRGRRDAEPSKAQFDQDGVFEVKMKLPQVPEQLSVWVRDNKNGAKKQFTIAAPEFHKKYALDLHNDEVTPFRHLEDILEELEGAGMVNSAQIPRAKKLVAASAPAAAAEEPEHEHELLQAIRATILAIGAIMEQKVVAHHAMLKKELEAEVAERVAKPLAEMHGRMVKLEDELRYVEEEMEKGIAESVDAQFAHMHTRKLKVSFV